MALSWNLDTADTIDFASFVEFFKAQGDALFDSQLDESALMMRRLANNREFLTERLNQELENSQSLMGFQANNVYTPQTFILSSQKAFFVRVNIWAPLQQRPGEGLFFYDTAHDHNFAFLTVGYLGSGYRTQISEYDPATLIGYTDERVALRFLEDTKLPFGKVMFFRQNLDIHTQIPPDELSISLNVLKKPTEPRSDQYFFDIAQGRSLGKADKHPVGLLIRLAGAVGNDHSVELLKRIAATDNARRTRLAAYDAIAKLSTPEIWERALEDRDELIRMTAAQHLGTIERGGDRHAGS